MTERKRTGREGFGDDQGTRVGAPTPAEGREPKREPDRLSSSFRVSGTSGEDEDGTGAGAEAAEGIHTTERRDPGDKSALEDVDTGRSRHDEATVDRAGSEPVDRQREHLSGYGGEGGSPKSSSDVREPHEPEGRADQT